MNFMFLHMIKSKSGIQKVGTKSDSSHFFKETINSYSYTVKSDTVHY